MSYIHHQYWPLSPVIAKNRSSSNPVSTPWPIVQGILHSVVIQIPAGHNGLTGVKVTFNGQQIIPWSNNAWLVGSGDTFDFSWGQEIMATGLALVAYNTDISPHQFFAYADIEPILGTPPAEVGTSGDLALGNDTMLTAVASLAG